MKMGKKNDQVRALNYCAHAIEDLREFEIAYRDTAPKTASVLRRLTIMLQHSVKFILPNCCDLIDPNEFRQAHLDLARLPFPCVAFEAPWEKDDEIKELGGFEQAPATKRIALCWEPNPEYELLPGLNSILNSFPDGGVFIVPIYWGPAFKKWTISLGGAFLPYKNIMHKFTINESLPVTRIANEALIETGLITSKTKQYLAEPFYLLPELYEQALVSMNGDKEKLYAQIILDSRDETQMLIQACSVINCANVTTVKISAPTALNKKRQNQGKQPFFSYKVLQLSQGNDATGRFHAGGSHARPRMHLRRGHLRRLESKVIWVRPAMVNTGSKAGVVLKDYAVHPPCEPHIGPTET